MASRVLFFLSGLFLLLLLLPWGIRFKYTEGLEKKVNAEKERTGKDGLYSKTCTSFKEYLALLSKVWMRPYLGKAKSL